MQKFSLFLLLLSIVSCYSSKNIKNTILRVKPGDSLNTISLRLKKQNIIQYPLNFKILAKLKNKKFVLKAGVYSIPPHTSYQKILNILNAGISIGEFFTIPEGFNIFQIAAFLEKHDIVSAHAFLTEIYNSPFLIKIGLKQNIEYSIDKLKTLHDKNGYTFIVPEKIPEYSLEGYLFPDTYNFQKNMVAKNVVQLFINRFMQIVDSSILDEIKAKNKTLHEIIILASIIQKEASNNSEMPFVSGVYYNRLKLNMKLQACPTLIYALILDGEYRGTLLKEKHLKPPWPSPYNTYYISKLPKGPIANPGKSAILAALYPIEHQYLYFARNPEGTNTFSKTLEEHNINANRWRRFKEKRKIREVS